MRAEPKRKSTVTRLRNKIIIPPQQKKFEKSRIKLRMKVIIGNLDNANTEI